MSRLGDAIRRVRMGAGLSQTEAAELLGIGPTYLSHLEAGRRVPSLSILRCVAALPDVPFPLIERLAFAAIDVPNRDAPPEDQP